MKYFGKTNYYGRFDTWTCEPTESAKMATHNKDKYENVQPSARLNYWLFEKIETPKLYCYIYMHC